MAKMGGVNEHLGGMHVGDNGKSGSFPNNATQRGGMSRGGVNKDLGGGDLQDEVYASKFLEATGYVNPKKIGITGGSYGGFMTLMAIGRSPEVWAAGVELFGIINWMTMLQHEDAMLQEYEKSLLGDPVKDRATYDVASPITYIHQVKAPLLVLQGENDPRVPKEEAEQVVELLKKDGKTVMFSTHILADAEMLCDRVGVIVGGKLRGVGAPGTLVDMKTQGMEILFELTGASAAPLLSKAARTGDRYRLQVAEEELYAAIEQLREAGARIHSVSQVRATLEEFFMNLVEADRAQASAIEVSGK